MRFLNCLVLLFVLASCTPTLHQLKRYEYAKELKSKTLQVELINEDEAIALFNKYEYNKKAERLKEETEKENEKIRSAFIDNFTFTNFVFVTKEEANTNLPLLTIQVKENIGRSDDGPQISHFINYVISERGEEKVRVEDDVNSRNFNYSFGVKQLNNQLNKYYKNAK